MRKSICTQVTRRFACQRGRATDHAWHHLRAQHAPIQSPPLPNSPHARPCAPRSPAEPARCKVHFMPRLRARRPLGATADPAAADARASGCRRQPTAPSRPLPPFGPYRLAPMVRSCRAEPGDIPSRLMEASLRKAMTFRLQSFFCFSALWLPAEIEGGDPLRRWRAAATRPPARMSGTPGSASEATSLVRQVRCARVRCTRRSLPLLCALGMLCRRWETAADLARHVRQRRGACDPALHRAVGQELARILRACLSTSEDEVQYQGVGTQVSPRLRQQRSLS